MKFRIDLSEGESIPHGWGFAHIHFGERRKSTICYPIPFNLVSRLWCELCESIFFPRWGWGKKRYAAVRREAYTAGFQEGLNFVADIVKTSANESFRRELRAAIDAKTEELTEGDKHGQG